MASIVICPQCKKELRSATLSAADVQIRCPVCQTRFAAGSAQTLASPVLANSSPAGTSSQRRFLVGLLGGFTILAILAVTAFVWPGFLRNGGLSAIARANQAQAHNLLAYVPTNSSVVVGLHVGQVRKSHDLEKAWKIIKNKLAQFSAIPAEAHDLIGDVDTVLFARRGTTPGTSVCIVSTDNPFDAGKIQRAVNAGPAQKHGGKALYPCGDQLTGKASYLSLPTDRVAVLGFMPAEQLAKEITEATRSRIHPELKAQIDQVSGSVIWGAVLFDPETQQALKQLEEKLASFAAGIAEFKTIAPIAQRGKGAVVTLDVADEQKIKLSLGFTCRDANDAALLKTAVGNLWFNHGKNLVGLAGFVAGAKFGKLLGEVSQTFDLNQLDTSVLLSIEVNQATLEELLDVAPLLNNLVLP